MAANARPVGKTGRACSRSWPGSAGPVRLVSFGACWGALLGSLACLDLVLVLVGVLVVPLPLVLGLVLAVAGVLGLVLAVAGVFGLACLGLPVRFAALSGGAGDDLGLDVGQAVAGVLGEPGQVTDLLRELATSRPPAGLGLPPGLRLLAVGSAAAGLGRA